MISVVIPSYNAATVTLRTVRRLLRLGLQSRLPFEIIVVDDGSGSEDSALLLARQNEHIRVIRHATNRGRGAARNSGAKSASHDYLLFLDCDCHPASETFLTAHLQALAAGADVSLGPIQTPGSGFWERYQQAASVRRERAFAVGQVFVMTSANFMIRRRCFLRVGGFDEGYRAYGFEDRDLLVRLAEAGARMEYTPQAGVVHEADISLEALVHKMAAAGRSNAPRFRHRHPNVYRQLGYAMLDARLHPWLIPIGLAGGALVRRMATYFDRRLEKMPFPMAAVLVRLMTALAFMGGTAQSNPSKKLG